MTWTKNLRIRDNWPTWPTQSDDYDVSISVTFKTTIKIPIDDCYYANITVSQEIYWVTKICKNTMLEGHEHWEEILKLQ